MSIILSYGLPCKTVEHVWSGALNCYLDMLDKLQKRVYGTVGPAPAVS